MNPQEEQARLRKMAIRTLAIGGFVLVIIVGMAGSLALARAVPGAFSAIASAIVSLTSVFVPAGEEIIVSVPELTVGNGESFDISWEHVKKSSEGSYTFRYDCASGVSFTSPGPTGAAVTVFCNTPFNFLNESDTITLTARSSANRFIDVTLHIDFIPNGASAPTVSGSTLLTIANTEVTGSPDSVQPQNETPAPRPTPTRGTETTTITPIAAPGLTPSNPQGFIDLSVRVIEVGLVNKTTGAFTASSSPNRALATERVAVRFTVENLGSRTSDQWTFNAVLPTFPAHIFSSPTQQALGPGDRIEFTLAFDSFVDANEGVLTLNIDPTNRINEPNKTNNILKYTVKTIK